jgi:predicted small lipoprotein YifL
MARMPQILVRSIPASVSVSLAGSIAAAAITLLSACGQKGPLTLPPPPPSPQSQPQSKPAPERPLPDVPATSDKK